MKQKEFSRDTRAKSTKSEDKLNKKQSVKDVQKKAYVFFDLYKIDISPSIIRDRKRR